MPKDVCMKCRKVAEVKLCADDLLCHDCDTENERQLAAISAQRSAGQSIATPAAELNPTRSHDETRSHSSKHSSTHPSTETPSMAAEGHCLIVNELLTYIKFYRNCANLGYLKKVVLGFYAANDITIAKAKLLSTFSCLQETSYATGRRGSSARSQHEAELDDIIGAFAAVDSKGLLKGVHFVAENLDQLPKYGPEEINICAVVDRQRVIDTNLSALATRLDDMEKTTDGSVNNTALASLTSTMADLDKKMTNAMEMLSARIENNNACIAAVTETINKVRGPPVASTSEASSAMNIIVCGVVECKNPLQWRSLIDDALQFLVGRPVDISDMARIGGPYKEGRTRPVLVKLRSVWDRRIILSTRYKLKGYKDRIYIYPDEPLETRRKQTLERLKAKAEDDGKVATVLNNELIIDGVLVFSLEKGFCNPVSTSERSSE